MYLLWYFLGRDHLLGSLHLAGYALLCYRFLRLLPRFISVFARACQSGPEAFSAWSTQMSKKLCVIHQEYAWSSHWSWLAPSLTLPQSFLLQYQRDTSHLWRSSVSDTNPGSDLDSRTRFCWPSAHWLLARPCQKPSTWAWTSSVWDRRHQSCSYLWSVPSYWSVHTSFWTHGTDGTSYSVWSATSKACPVSCYFALLSWEQKRHWLTALLVFHRPFNWLSACSAGLCDGSLHWT